MIKAWQLFLVREPPANPFLPSTIGIVPVDALNVSNVEVFVCLVHNVDWVHCNSSALVDYTWQYQSSIVPNLENYCTTASSTHLHTTGCHHCTTIGSTIVFHRVPPIVSHLAVPFYDTRSHQCTTLVSTSVIHQVSPMYHTC
jgi:hypothetical protein